MREARFKEGFECPQCASEHVVRFGKYNGRQRYRCKCRGESSPIQPTPSCTVPEKATNGLRLLTVCLKAILYENRPKS
jgi:hypothetical protein